MSSFKGNPILVIAIVIGIIWVFYSFSNEDEYTGFFYPMAGNLIEDVQSETNFVSLDECRVWASNQALKYNVEDFDYECGKNCKLEGEKPYVCEETLE